MAEKEALSSGVAMLIGVVLGGVMVGGVLMWRMERRIDRYFANKVNSQRTGRRAAQPARRQPARSRLRPLPRPQRLTPYQRTLKRRKWKALSRQMGQAKGGLLMRLGLLSLTDVARLLGQSRPLEARFLQGRPRGQYYDALHFFLRKVKQGHSFSGLAVQLWWHRDKEPIQQRWARYKRRFRPPKATSHPTSRPALPTLAFERKNTRSLIARLRPHNAIALMTCQASFCQRRHMAAIARWLHRRISQNKRQTRPKP